MPTPLLNVLLSLSPFVAISQSAVYNDKWQPPAPFTIHVNDSIYNTTWASNFNDSSLVYLDLPFLNRIPIKFKVIISRDTVPVHHSGIIPNVQMKYVVEENNTKWFNAIGPTVRASEIDHFLDKRIYVESNGKPVVIEDMNITFFDLYNNAVTCNLHQTRLLIKSMPVTWTPQYFCIEDAVVNVNGKRMKIAFIKIACKII